MENDDDLIIDSICQDTNIVQVIMNFLKSPLDEENVPAIKCIGQIFSGSNPANCDLFLFHGTLDALA